MSGGVAARYPDELRERVEAYLEGLTFSHAPVTDGLQDAMRYSLLAGGKRIRPVLALATARSLGRDADDVLPLAAALELIHTYSLIHDDLPAMDDDDLRRGRPTCHVAFDEATAILAGDAMLAQAFEIVAAGVPECALQGCLVELARAAGPGKLVGGQYDDLHPDGVEASQAGLQRIHRRKTGALIKVSLRMGGLIGRASAEQLSALSGYGDCLGLAFQIVDDLLDLGQADLPRFAG